MNNAIIIIGAFVLLTALLKFVKELAIVFAVVLMITGGFLYYKYYSLDTITNKCQVVLVQDNSVRSIGVEAQFGNPPNNFFVSNFEDVKNGPTKIIITYSNKVPKDELDKLRAKLTKEGIKP